jgi:hypothetical protein
MQIVVDDVRRVVVDDTEVVIVVVIVVHCCDGSCSPLGTAVWIKNVVFVCCHSNKREILK